MPNTNCVVKDCSNSTKKLKKWKEGYCDLHEINYGTGRCTCPPPFVLFPFPTKTEEKDPWVNAVKRKEKVNGKWVTWKPRKYSRVCSEHFEDKMPTKAHPVPMLKMGYGDMVLKTRRKAPRKRVISPTPGECSDTDVTPIPEAPVSEHVELENDDEEMIIDAIIAPASHAESYRPSCSEINMTAYDNDHRYLFQCTCSALCRCPGCLKKDKEIRQLQEQLDQMTINVKKEKEDVKQRKSLSKYLLSNDNKVSFYTGLPNRATFYALFNNFKSRAASMRYWKGVVSMKKGVRKFKVTPKKSGPARKLLLVDEFLLTLMKLRLNLCIEDLADRFCISQATTSSIFNTWISFLRQELSPLVFFPSRDIVHATLPKAFRDKGSKPRVIIDCTEVFIERPRDLQSQALSWSDYKKHNTVKFLVGITPQGHIGYVSSVWGGRTTDRYIVQHSGFLNHLDPGDEVMADRGFPIKEDLMLRRAKLTIPPGARGHEQMTKENVDLTKLVANLRIHVERAINRIKWFTILKGTMPITLLPRIDDIVIVCSALCNLLPPLVD